MKKLFVFSSVYSKGIISYGERRQIEILVKAGHKTKEIAELLGGRSERTIRREIARGTVELLNSDLKTRKEYSADAAQSDYDKKAKAKGPRLKIGKNFALIEFVEDIIIKERYSPYSALEKAKKRNIPVNICLKTLYNYIDQGLFLKLTNKDLPVKKKAPKRDYNHVRRANNHNGTSIEERPESVETRADFGNWELDTVVGKQGTKSVLMVMTERSLNSEIIRKIANKSEACIVAELNKLERKYGSKKFREIFKTITCDNGCENLDYVGMERSVLIKGQRTKIYYAHPYSAYERGSNECANKLIRRFIPKGSDISKFTKKQIKYIENRINNYPRRMFGGYSSADLLNMIGISL